LTAELNEQSILEFAKISNFLLCEYEFLYNGKRQTTSRQEMKQNEMVFYDLLLDELNTLDNNYTSEKLDHQDCLLKIIGVSLDDLVVDIKNKIICFKSFFNSDATRLNYRKGQETRNELSNFYVFSVDFGSKRISLDLAAPAFNLNEALLRHPWVSSIQEIHSIQAPHLDIVESSVVASTAAERDDDETDDDDTVPFGLESTAAERDDDETVFLGLKSSAVASTAAERRDDDDTVSFGLESTAAERDDDDTVPPTIFTPGKRTTNLFGTSNNVKKLRNSFTHAKV
jgi:hypothetical protein